MKVLITSGGGAKGAFSVGALQFLKEERQLSHFDLISGTSTGALIASLAAIGDVETLIDVYSNTSNRDVVKPVNLIESLTNGNKFIFNTDPLLDQVNNQINQPTFDAIMQSNTNLCLNAISLQTGKLNIFSTKPINASPRYTQHLITTREMMTQAMVASSNQAVFTEPVRIGNEDFVDGGNREVVPTRVVVNNLPPGQDHEIYILSNNPDEIVTLPDSQLSDLLMILLRAISMFIQEVRENDLDTLATFRDQMVNSQNSDVKIFYICPERELDPEFPTGLRFDKVKMLEWKIKGQLRAKTIIESNPNGNFTGRRAF